MRHEIIVRMVTTRQRPRAFRGSPCGTHLPVLVLPRKVILGHAPPIPLYEPSMPFPNRFERHPRCLIVSSVPGTDTRGGLTDKATNRVLDGMFERLLQPILVTLELHDKLTGLARKIT